MKYLAPPHFQQVPGLTVWVMSLLNVKDDRQVLGPQCTSRWNWTENHTFLLGRGDGQRRERE